MTAPKITPVEKRAALLERAILDGGLARMRKAKGWGKREAAEIVKLLHAHVARRDAS